MNICDRFDSCSLNYFNKLTNCNAVPLRCNKIESHDHIPNNTTRACANLSRICRIGLFGVYFEVQFSKNRNTCFAWSARILHILVPIYMHMYVCTNIHSSVALTHMFRLRFLPSSSLCASLIFSFRFGVSYIRPVSIFRRVLLYVCIIHILSSRLLRRRMKKFARIHCMYVCVGFFTPVNCSAWHMIILWFGVWQ